MALLKGDICKTVIAILILGASPFLCVVSPCSEATKTGRAVKMGHLSLTDIVKIGYTLNMKSDLLSFILKLGLVVVISAFIWRLFEPKTQRARIFRAALLALALLVTLAVVQSIGI